MTELVLAKGAGGFLVPIDQPSMDLIAGMRMGEGMALKMRTHNNPKFHRKMMALYKLAFDAWEPAELTYRGQVVRKEFNQFRRDLTVLAGYYDASVNFRGDVRLTAKSLNFSTMDQPEREALYSAVIDVVLQHILTRYKRADLDDVIAQTLRFAG